MLKVFASMFIDIYREKKKEKKRKKRQTLYLHILGSTRKKDMRTDIRIVFQIFFVQLQKERKNTNKTNETFLDEKKKKKMRRLCTLSEIKHVFIDFGLLVFLINMWCRNFDHCRWWCRWRSFRCHNRSLLLLLLLMLLLRGGSCRWR